MVKNLTERLIVLGPAYDLRRRTPANVTITILLACKTETFFMRNDTVN